MIELEIIATRHKEGQEPWIQRESIKEFSTMNELNKELRDAVDFYQKAGGYSVLAYSIKDGEKKQVFNKYVSGEHERLAKKSEDGEIVDVAAEMKKARKAKKLKKNG